MNTTTYSMVVWLCIHTYNVVAGTVLKKLKRTDDIYSMHTNRVIKNNIWSCIRVGITNIYIHIIFESLLGDWHRSLVSCHKNNIDHSRWIIMLSYALYFNLGVNTNQGLLLLTADDGYCTVT